MGSPSSESEDRRSPFMTLAGYIGVRGTPQNEGAKTIAMTAPVTMKQSDEVSEVVYFTLFRSQYYMTQLVGQGTIHCYDSTCDHGK